MLHPWFVRLLAQQHIEDLLRDAGAGRPRPERRPVSATQIRARAAKRERVLPDAVRDAA